MSYRVTITGSESTGKTTLSERLANHYRTIFAPDYSRYYIGQLNHKYNQNDLIEIARGIIEQEDKMMAEANQVLFSDNDLLNIKIWLEYYKWEVPAWLEEQIVNRKSDLYLLCDIDLPWIPDPQRANPHDRFELFNQFKAGLAHVKANFKLVTGTNQQVRTDKAIQHIDFLLNSHSP